MKAYRVIMQAYAIIDVEAENEEEAEKIALSAPCENWEVSSLSEDYCPIVYEDEE